MKLNLRPLPANELQMPGLLAVSYETERHSATEKGNDQQILDFNITVYKQQKLLNWIQLCPCADSNCIEFKNKFIDEDEECNTINEKVLLYAEHWAVFNGYKKIIIHACAQSVPYYLCMKYASEGQPVQESGMLLYKVVKHL